MLRLVQRYLHGTAREGRTSSPAAVPPVHVEAISKFREGIAAKFAVFFSLLVLVATGTVGFLVYQGAKDSLVHTSNERLKHTADVIGVRLDASVEAIAKDLHFLVATPPVQGLVRAHVDGVTVRDADQEQAFIDPQTNIDDREWRDQLANTLSVFLENRPSYVRISFIGLTKQGGHEVVRVEKRDGTPRRLPASALHAQRNDPFFRKAIALPEGAFHLSNIELTPTSDGRAPMPLMRAITPVYAANGRVYGGIAIHVDARPMFEAVTSLIDAGFSLYLANEKGQFLMRPAANRFTDRFPEAAPWRARSSDQPLMLQLEGDGGSDRMAYFEHVAIGMAPSEHHLIVGVTSPYDAIRAQVQQVRTNSLLVTLFFGLLGIGLALLFSGYLTYPLRQVTRALSRFGRDRDEPRAAVQLPTHRRDEIGVLARTFDAMTRQIKQQMHELAEKEHRQRIILETSAEGIIVVTEDGVIETFNQTAERLFGRSAEAVEGRSIGPLLDIPDGARTSDASWLPPWKQVGSGHEVTGRRADGSLVPLSLGVSAFELFGEQKYALFLQDISERKRYERILQDAKEKAEEVARLKSTFLANMSHEIRTPLTTVIGYAGVLAEEASDKHKEFAQFIRNSGERLMETLNSVLSMAQLEASGVEIQLDVLDVAEEAREITALFQPLADENDLELRYEAPEAADGGPWAHLDRGALSSILQNLVGNAIKFTEDGHVAVRVTGDGDEVHLHVEDTGIGMDASFLPHLFDEFVQESTGVRRSHEGSGLGLAITKRLVDLMGGRIEVDSTKGEGTTFTVSFPRAEPALYEADNAPSVSPAPPQPAEAPRKKLLVVEDNPETGALMQELLRAAYDVTVVADGTAALRRAQACSYDLVLLDINLGGGPSGADVLRQLRAQPAYAHTPIAAVTAYALPGDRDRFLQMGFDAYLDKPFAPEDLDAVMEQLGHAADEAERPPRPARSRSRSRGRNDRAPSRDRP